LERSILEIKYLQMKKYPLIVVVIIMGLIQNSIAQEDKPEASAADLAKKLSNPVASLISVPFQNNTDVGIGEFNGSRNTLNIQPVIPIGLTYKLNLITRVILPVISQHDITGNNEQQFGLSDAVASAFLSPAEAKNGLVWGGGPVFLLPVATDDMLGTKKWGIGPTALILKQAKGWTFGALVNQIWSIAGDADRSNVNQMFLQPFLTYNWESGAGLGINSEITQNWEANTTSVFINPTISGVIKLGNQIVSLLVGPRIQVAAPESGKANFGVRTVVIFVFPK
jgi:hypothetical protein